MLIICFRITWHASGKHRLLGWALQIYRIKVSDIKITSLCGQQMFQIILLNSNVRELLASVEIKCTILKLSSNRLSIELGIQIINFKNKFHGSAQHILGLSDLIPIKIILKLTLRNVSI